ncbi:Signal transduction histidine kinase [Cnuella takakiae]|uniref:histidine kinase n=1 Tax=Cnuella takakiae TaxID=1302690 RepID=A0A1M5C4C9_9BACT|nr:histidine kinase [Cnuella takakiae]OLY93620.1 two-component sensor histidine kinase [Cnuella takakiae]SHF49467.1 Signal transduction histidine kinase [Cnuella takakiae]
MFLLQTTATNGISLVLFLGTLGMLVLTIGLILFIIFHQRRVIRYQLQLQRMEQEQQKILLKASIHLQEAERQRIAADLHDDAGPLLATARLYLTENLVNMDKESQLQSIFQARQILDDTIQLVRNISHSLMPPTLKNFGLESAVNDMFYKISNSGAIQAFSRFHEYGQRLPMEIELNLFRVVQELLNNILKHSQSSFIRLSQNQRDGVFVLCLQHDGHGLVQADFEEMNKSANGLGLKNISSRLKVAQGSIFFEKDNASKYYQITIEVPTEHFSQP